MRAIITQRQFAEKFGKGSNWRMYVKRILVDGSVRIYKYVVPTIPAARKAARWFAQDERVRAVSIINIMPREALHGVMVRGQVKWHKL